MPAITLNRDRFCSFLDRSLSVEEMAKWLPWLGLDLQNVGPDYVKVEFNPNRVDFCSYAGIARAFKGLMGWETGLPEYNVKKGNITLNIDSTVGEVRPFMLAAVVREINLDSEVVRELMEMQEDLHWGVGRDRKKASIGVHNLNSVEPPFTYTTGEPDGVRFIPLDKMEEMSLQEILEKHEKGVAYSHLVDWASRYPLLVDRKGEVLSMPPIINGELTRVDDYTKDLFLDVTGTDLNAVVRSLNVLVTALADMGGTVETVEVKHPDGTVASPDLTPEKMKLRVGYANELLGLRLPDARVVECLRKCRLDAERVNKGVLEVSISAYRIDVLHEVDLVEEVAIGYGYYRLKPTRPTTVTTGQQHEMNELANYVRQIMIGLGFTEAMNFILTNEDTQFERMRMEIGRVVRLANPVSTEYSIIRVNLLPGLLENLSGNRHESYPQRVFEVSDVVVVDEKAETRSERRLHVAGVSSHPTANYTEIRSFVEALLTNLGITDYKIKGVDHPSFLEGRVATLTIKRKGRGLLGEIHPQVLNNFELENPVSAFEISLEEIK
ncbi:MAG: phenylalanine--tRNA ligase subunit beta [Candidatus Bathyarchaeota archaeon]|nr:phenylalanine--tRNA ligase subunit beta [Candidatus Bathyarchaeota archaeon]MDH5733357.1 phenylalanine--tRNA ligase subunit beta [Candidatus Bathyarchaeota archaeon]